MNKNKIIEKWNKLKKKIFSSVDIFFTLANQIARNEKIVEQNLSSQFETFISECDKSKRK